MMDVSIKQGSEAYLRMMLHKDEHFTGGDASPSKSMGTSVR
jgi:hypothetical protein